MIKEARDDLNYLLGANPEDFDLWEVKDAIIFLSDTIDDFEYQIGAPREIFQGQDYDSWLMKARYKLNKVKSARRRFSGYLFKLKQESDLNLIKSLVRSYLSGNENVLDTLKSTVKEHE